MRLSLGFLSVAACAGPAVHATTMVDQPPTDTARIATVDIAPLNVDVPLGAASATEAPELQSATKMNLARAAIDELGKRSYSVGALLSRGSKSTADATLFINSGAYVPMPYLPEDTLSDHPATRTAHVSDRVNAGFAIASCGNNASCAIVATGDAGAAQVTSVCQGDLACSMTLGARVGASRSFHTDDSDETVDATDDSDETVEATDDNHDAVMPDEPPAMYVGMTLVDNRTGAILWRAHATSAANATHATEVASTVHSVIASLPARPR